MTEQNSTYSDADRANSGCKSDQTLSDYYKTANFNIRYQNLCSEQVEPQETNGLIMLHDVRVLKTAATEIAPIFQVI